MKGDSYAGLFIVATVVLVIVALVRNVVWRMRIERINAPGFESWPKLYRTRRGAILLQAVFASPVTMKTAKSWAAGVGFLFGVSTVLSLQVPFIPPASYIERNWFALACGAVVWWLAFRPLQWVFRRTLWRTSNPLLMTFDDGAIVWKGEEQGGKLARKARVKAGEQWNVQVSVPHRRAAEELRINDERRLRNKKPLQMFYQQCSEVVIYAGPGLPRTHGVAALANDEQGTKGRALVAAIMAAQAYALQVKNPAGVTSPLTLDPAPPGKAAEPEPPPGKGLFG